MLAAIPFPLTDVGPNRMPIGAKSRRRFRAQVRVRVVRVEEYSFAGIREFPSVHTFVTDFLTVYTETNLRRAEIHSDHLSFGRLAKARDYIRMASYAVRIPAACRMARLTAVFAICTL